MACPSAQMPTLPQLVWAVTLTAAVTGLEVWGAHQSGSMALWGEAIHFFADLWAFGVAWYALTPVKPGSRWAYGRAPVLAVGGLINALVQMGLAIGLMVESGLRGWHPEPVEGGWMVIVALVGLGVNLGLMRLFGGRHVHQDDAVEGARVHFLADAGLCAATVLAAVGVAWGLPVQLDSLLGFLAAVLMAWMSLRLFARVVQTLLARTPQSVHLPTLIKALQSEPGVIQVHHLHVWPVNDRRLASVHILVHRPPVGLLERLHTIFQTHGVDHPTVQLEEHCPEVAGLPQK